MTQCPPLNDPNYQANGPWSFCPSIGADYFFIVLFGLATIGHLAEAILYRKVYSLVIIIAAAWQTAGFIFRAISIRNFWQTGPYSAWFVLILTGPLWINAYVYMCMGRMVWNFIPDKRLCRVKAWRFGLLFVLLDITAFLVQLAGASIASGTNNTAKTTLLGLHIYMGGIGLQEFFILGFTFLAIQFHRQLNQQPTTPRRRNAFQLLYVTYAVLFFITVRIIFRLIEYSTGLHSTIPNHEVYMYIFDSTPMLLALVLYLVFHPGRLMPGKESDFPSRRERKEISRLMKTGEFGKREEQGLVPVQAPTHAYEPVGSSHTRSLSPEPMAQTAKFSGDTRYYGAENV
ncbi:MAG: hypothetical protein M1821_003763 [Bathelium mastoideum]|nr:MAG: hypothetical protein M1821_003763 [Bathelium mastoideum]